LINVTARITLGPPPVEPEQPPANISSSTPFAAIGHVSKSAVAKPVVVIINTA